MAHQQVALQGSNKGAITKPVRRDGLIIFLLLALVFGYFYQDGGWNENSRYSLIFATVEQGTFKIDNYYNSAGSATGDYASYKGHIYSDKSIGPALLGVIFYEPIYQFNRLTHALSRETVKEILVFLVIGIPAAIAGSLMYILSYYLTRRRIRSYLATLAIALGTLYFPFAIVLFSHTLTAALLFSAFFMIFFLSESPSKKKNVYLFLIGLILGFALISEYPAGIVIVVLVVYYFLVIWKRREYRNAASVLLPALGGLIPIAMQLVYNGICFGSDFSIGYEHLVNQFFSASMSQGLEGISWPRLSVMYDMTFQPTVGIFWESPVLLLAFAGAAVMFIRKLYRREAVVAGVSILAYIIILSGYFMWWGGYSVGPRQILPMLPFFLIFLIFVPKALDWLFVPLTVVSIGQMVIAAASTVETPDTYAAHISSLRFFQYSNIWSYDWKQLLNGYFNQNLGHSVLHLKDFASLIPLLVIFVVISTVFFWREIKKK